MTCLLIHAWKMSSADPSSGSAEVERALGAFSVTDDLFFSSGIASITNVLIGLTKYSDGSEFMKTLDS
jgi:hypothetical protein